MEPSAGFVRTFCSTRPPMVVFLLCLASFGITTFSLSVYVAQSDRIRNPDVLDWNSLLTKLTKLDFCLPSTPSKYNITGMAQAKEDVNVSLSVQVSDEFANSFYQSAGRADQGISAKGSIGVQFVGKGLPLEYLHDSISVGFQFPPQSQVIGQSVINVCLEISGPKGLLQFLEFNDTSCNLSHGVSDAHDLPLMIHSPDHKPTYWCERDPNDVNVNLALEMDFNNPDWTMYVSAKDKELIHLHLMVTSVFLFAILAAVIIAFLVKSVNRKQIDARGDHHLIVMTHSGENSS